MHKTNSVSGPHRPDLDTSEAGRWDFRRNLNRLVEVFRLDEEVAAELLLRLGKRAIGGRDFTVLHPDRRRCAGGLRRSHRFEPGKCLGPSDPTGIFWVADNHTGVSALYSPNGKPIPLVVTTGKSCLGARLRFLVSLPMTPTEEQLTALGNYKDIINQHLPEIADGIAVTPQTLKGWMEDKGEPTSEQAQKILDFLRDKIGRGPQV